ncbi:MAG: M56 family metallopeptidase [Candidatus Neomarinimicrobiota bacterium]
MVNLLNTVSIHWWTYFVPLVIQNTLFLALVYSALSYLKKIPAQSRYGIALLGLIKLLIPAFIPLSLLTVSQIADLNQMVILAPVITTTTVTLPVPAATLTVPAITMLGWATVAALMLLQPLFALGRIRYQLRQAQVVEERTTAGGTKVRIHKTGRVTLPMTIGMFSKHIYVPVLWDSWSIEYREMALRHEIAHIERHDGLVSGIQMLAQALYFFHPLVWLLNRSIDELREMVCDEAAQGQQDHDSIIYSRFLVDVAEHMVRAQVDCPTVNSLLKKKKELLNRIQYLLEDKMQTNHRFRSIIMPVLVSLALLLSWNCQSQIAKPIIKADATEKGYEVPEDIKFIPYDEPPEPLGGFDAIMNNVVYPKAALEAGIEGTIIVMAHIDETGVVNETRVVKSIPGSGLDEAAALAISTTKFKPAQQRDRTVGVWITIPVNFKLNDKEKTGAVDQAKEFIPYDQPPVPIGGYTAIKANVIYPELALKAGIEGTVIVQTFVDKTGKVSKTVILRSPDDVLNDAAIAAINKTVFQPAMAQDQPVGVWISIPIYFSLSNDKPVPESQK